MSFLSKNDCDYNCDISSFYNSTTIISLVDKHFKKDISTPVKYTYLKLFFTYQNFKFNYVNLQKLSSNLNIQKKTLGNHLKKLEEVGVLKKRYDIYNNGIRKIANSLFVQINLPSSK